MTCDDCLNPSIGLFVVAMPAPVETRLCGACARGYGPLLKEVVEDHTRSGPTAAEILRAEHPVQPTACLIGRDETTPARG